jgi:hypothetical protein
MSGGTPRVVRDCLLKEPARPRTPRRPGPAGLWARIVPRLLALNACIWHNWLIGAPVKRSLIACDHV